MASGGAILTGGTIGGIGRPTVGVEIEISSVTDISPNSLTSVLVELDRVQLVPKYLDDSRGLDITAEVDLGDGDTGTKTAENVTFTNGENINIVKIQRRSDTDISNIVVENLNKSGSTVHGTLNIQVSHPELKESYNQIFYISNETTIVDNFESQNLSAWTNQGVSDGSISSDSAEGSYSLVVSAAGSNGNYYRSWNPPSSGIFDLAFDWKVENVGDFATVADFADTSADAADGWGRIVHTGGDGSAVEIESASSRTNVGSMNFGQWYSVSITLDTDSKEIKKVNLDGSITNIEESFRGSSVANDIGIRMGDEGSSNKSYIDNIRIL